MNYNGTQSLNLLNNGDLVVVGNLQFTFVSGRLIPVTSTGSPLSLENFAAKLPINFSAYHALATSYSAADISSSGTVTFIGHARQRATNFVKTLDGVFKSAMKSGSVKSKKGHSWGKSILHERNPVKVSDIPGGMLFDFPDLLIKVKGKYEYEFV